MKKIFFLTAMIMIVMIGSSKASGMMSNAASEDSVSFTLSSQVTSSTADCVVDLNVVRIITDLDDETLSGIDITPGTTKVFRGEEARALIGKKVKIIAIYWARSTVSYTWQTLGYGANPSAYIVLVKANKNYVFDFKVWTYPWDDKKK